MEQYHITGMSCAACSARVEKAVSAVDGVTACAVSLLTNSMSVEGTASSEQIIKAVEKAGYGASRTQMDSKESPQTSELAEFEDQETPRLKGRLRTSVILLIPLMYVSMGHMMWDFPLPSFFDGNPVAIGLVQLLAGGIDLHTVVSVRRLVFYGDGGLSGKILFGDQGRRGIGRRGGSLE